MSWDAELRALTERVAGPLFKRPEPRAIFGDLVRRLWDTATHRQIGTPLTGHRGGATGVAFSLDRRSRTLASAGVSEIERDDGTVQLWNVWRSRTIFY